MRGRIARACGCLGVLIWLASAEAAAQSQTSGATPPPPPPNCAKCGGPPPPPAAVPTPAPTLVAPQPAVAVHVASPRVARGRTEKISVDASTDNVVSMVIRYKTGKPVVFRSRVNGSGTLIKAWKVPRTAAVGKATVTITVQGSSSYTKTVTFTVTK